MELQGVVRPDGDNGILHGAFFVDLVEAALARDNARLEQLRTQGQELMPAAALVDAIAVLSGFNAVTRVADLIGIGLDEQTALSTVDMRAELGLNDFAHGRGVNLPADLL